MFQDLDSTLQNMLDTPSAPADLRSAEVSFLTPDKAFTPGAATIDLFLFEVHENREQRNPEPIIELDSTGMYVRRRPPIRVDCVYLVTAWSTRSAALKIQEEHLLLALALAWLSRYPVIPLPLLSGSMATQPFPLAMKVAQSDEHLSLSEFWNALGIAPRAGFTVTVTISMELNLQTPEGEPVVTKEIKIDKLLAPETLGATLDLGFEIAGTLRAAGTLVPIANAAVKLVELGQTATSDSLGHFYFSILSAGSFTLTSSAAGFSPATKAITVPAAVLNAYDIQMTP